MQDIRNEAAEALARAFARIDDATRTALADVERTLPPRLLARYEELRREGYLPMEALTEMEREAA